MKMKKKTLKRVFGVFDVIVILAMLLQPVSMTSLATLAMAQGEDVVVEEQEIERDGAEDVENVKKDDEIEEDPEVERELIDEDIEKDTDDLREYDDAEDIEDIEDIEDVEDIKESDEAVVGENEHNDQSEDEQIVIEENVDISDSETIEDESDEVRIVKEDEDIILEEGVGVILEEADSVVVEDEKDDEEKDDEEKEKEEQGDEKEVEVSENVKDLEDVGVWSKNKNGSWSIVVSQGNTYTLPGSDLEIEFKRIDQGFGEITVDEISLTSKQVTVLDALGSTVWDITSNMENGSFEYELSLPLYMSIDPENVGVVYFEDKEDLDDLEKMEKVESRDIDVMEEYGQVIVKDLDHFTTFVIRTYSDGTFTTNKTQYAQGETVYIEATGLFVSRWYKIDIFEPDNTKHSVFGCDNDHTELNEEYVLDGNAPTSSLWRVEIEKFNTKGNCQSGNDVRDQASVQFEVVTGQVSPSFPTYEECRAQGKKYELCHATSSQENPFVHINVSCNALYGGGNGNAGHLSENGTQASGHEDDRPVDEHGNCPGEDDPVRGSVSGIKFEDKNSNGLRDDGEEAVSDWNIRLLTRTSDGDILIDEMSTDGGHYSFGSLRSGRYMVCEESRDEWIQTFPTGDQYPLDPSGNSQRCHEFSIEDQGHHAIEKNFGNAQSDVQLQSISGYKLDYVTQQGIEGWEITLCQLGANDVDGAGECEEEMTTHTNSDGYYEFKDLVPAIYRVKEGTSGEYTTMSPASGSYVVNLFTNEMKALGNLVANGGFERPVVHGDWTIFGDGTPELAWDVEWYNGSASYGGFTRPTKGQLEIQRDLENWTNYEGEQYAELDSDWGVGDIEPSSIRISQRLATCAGGEYDLSYAWSPRPNVAVNVMETRWRGIEIDEHNTSGGGDTSWTEESYDISAVSETTKLQFTEVGVPNTVGMFLDDVVVEQTNMCDLGDIIFYNRSNEVEPEPYCGDGDLDLELEQCDDGNNDNGDGCSAICEIEEGPICGDGEVNQTWEMCDGTDGVSAGENFCTVGCELKPIYDGTHTCSEGLEPSFLRSYEVDSRDADGIAVNDLQVGSEYLFAAAGTFHSSAGSHVSDAGYTSVDNWSSLASEFGIRGIGNDYAAHALLGDMGTGEVGVIDWGEYATDHIYRKSFVAPSSSSRFVIGDRYSNWFNAPMQNQSGMGDNEGLLGLDVYECVEAKGVVHVTKFKDLDDPDSEGYGVFDEGEETLSGWTIELNDESDNVISKVTDAQGGAIFEEVGSGGYLLSEVLQDGWEQTGIYCEDQSQEVVQETVEFALEQRAEVKQDQNSVRIFVEPGEIKQCFVGNQPLGELYIQKSNNALDVKRTGDSVIYTIVVEARNGDVQDVQVTDLPPENFVFVSGSDLASSSLGGAHIGSLALSHVYASPGIWDLGNIKNGEQVTLSYETKIEEVVDAGVYPDAAYATGLGKGGFLLAQAQDPGFLDQNFVGTDVEVADEIEPAPVKVTTDHEEEIEKKKNEIMLPATGTSMLWIALALGWMFVGFVMLIVGSPRAKKLITRNMRKVKRFLGAAAALLIFAFMIPAAFAADTVIVRSEEPRAAFNGTFEYDFVVLDLQGEVLTAQCMIQKPGAGAFEVFQTHVLSAGGDSGVCHVDVSVLDDEGVYSLKVQANASQRSAQSEVYSVDYDATHPGKPKYIEKDEKGTCKNKVELKTANDGQTEFIEIYRSLDEDYIADASTLIKTVPIGPDTKYSFTDEITGHDCEDDHFYAVRAFDDALNASEVREEELTETIEKDVDVFIEVGGGGSATGGFGTATGSEGLGQDDEDGAVDGSQDQDGEVAGEESGENGNDKNDGMGNSEGSSNNKKAGLAIIAAMLAYYAWRQIQISKNKKNKESK